MGPGCGDAGAYANGFDSPGAETHPRTEAGDNGEFFMFSVSCLQQLDWNNRVSSTHLLFLLSAKSILKVEQIQKAELSPAQ